METLKNLKSVPCGGEIIDMGELKKKYPEKFNESGQMDYKWFEADIRNKFNIYVRHDVDSISFTMMTKPASEGGKGCQLTDLVEVALHQLKALNKLYPCRENALTITKWEEGLMWQKARTEDRIKRSVEGKNEK